MYWKAASVVVLVFASAQFVQPVSVSRTSVGQVLAGANAPDTVLRIVEKLSRLPFLEHGVAVVLANFTDIMDRRPRC